MSEQRRTTDDKVSGDEERDPGACIGHEPERATETIPGGIGPKDERVSALDTQSTGSPPRDEPSGHRQGERAGDDRIRRGRRS